MNVESISSVAVIAAEPAKSRELYVDALGLPLEPDAGGEYFHSERIGGTKHFGVWPLAQAARRPASGPTSGPPTGPYRR
jgi:catechol 2,3-dioxygenase-like lactoylglutathione lyase family enzyme